MALDPRDDGEPTIVKPTPGGRARPSQAAARAVTQPLAAPASSVAFDFALLTSSSFNVIVGAAAQLLNLARRLRGSVSNRDVAALHARAVGEMKAFERMIMAAGVPPEQARAAHYALCATLDDIVLNTPWGAYSTWASNSLVSTFHVDVTGGERFFDLLTHLHKDPGTNRDVLALMYLCLSIGFEGRLRVIDQGALELSRIREGLYRTLRQVYGDFERELSPHWKGVEARHTPLRSSIALWTILSAAVVVLVAAYILFTALLANRSDLTMQAIAAAPPQDKATLAVIKPAPVPQVAPDALKTVTAALAPQIAAKQVEVSANGNVLMVRVHNAGMFASGSAVLTDKYKPVIDAIGKAISSQPGLVEVLGYTDDQPIHSARFPSNYELSLARAQAVTSVLSGTIPQNRLRVEGKGATNPIAPNATPAGREANRRTDILVHEVVTQGEADSDPPATAAGKTP
jgi:type VI secretion system protein ImpK